MTFIDTHTHIYTEEFDADRTDVIERARRAGAAALLLPNIDEASIEPMMALCNAHPDFCHPMMGLHPTELPADPSPVLDRMGAMLSEGTRAFVAVGEVGLDFYWDDSRRDEQIAVFERQIAWAERYGLPLVIHSRSAHRDLVDTLLPHREQLIRGGVFHCFGGTADEAGELLETFPGFYLGIGGVVTFKRSSLPEVLAAEVPLERLLTETDAPYLAPVPYRGKRNEPAYIPMVLARLADIYHITMEAAAEITTQNARRLFSI